MIDIQVVPLTYLEQMALAEDMGSAIPNAAWWLRAVNLASVRSMDGVPWIMPSHPNQFRALADKVGVEGMEQIYAAHRAAPAVEFGKAIEVQALSPAQELDFFEAAGALAEIPAWIGLAGIACAVKSIDGIDLPFPKTTSEILDRVRMLGDGGMEAATKILSQSRVERERERRQKLDEEATAKN